MGGESANSIGQLGFAPADLDSESAGSSGRFVRHPAMMAAALDRRVNSHWGWLSAP
jgi:hypothetical protein